MHASDLTGLLDFLRATERLKTVTRSAYTSTGDVESVAEHTWRLALMAMLVAPEFPDVDFARLVKICLVHDLGEAIGGDIPAPEQARRLATGEASGKGADERRDLVTLAAPLPPRLRDEVIALWDEYEAAASAEAKLAKALDKLETILQHTQGRNPADFDYRFNLGYGRQHTASPPLIAAIREVLDQATEDRAREREVTGPPVSIPTIQMPRTDAEIAGTHAVMRQLRPHLAKGEYVAMVRQMMRDEGYQLAALVDERGEVRAVAGYRYMTMLYCGRLLYVDDLVTDEAARSAGHGKRLLDWLKTEAKANGCRELQLISRTTREQAHRFYFREGLGIECFQFRIAL
jgi:5'-deoxynucleotidase YfbR-like HD superfamily hydrolase/GNAT superfamily N-acetyltransferase